MLGLWAIGEAPLGVDDPAHGAHPQLVTRRFASHSFATRADDDLASEYIAGRLARGLQISRSVSNGPDGMFGGLVTANFGDIEFANPDGGLDELVGMHPDGRPVTIKVGFSRVSSAARELIDPFDNFTEVFIGVAGGWELDQDRAILHLRDPGLRLQDELAKSRYRGTGGEEGNEDLADKTRPSVLGHVFNAEPQLVQPGYLIYQIHGGPVQSIDAVYDAGVPLTFHADATNFDHLVEMTVPRGTHYATCLSRGYIKLGGTPTGTVTVDLHGDAGPLGEPWSDSDPWSDDSLWQAGAGPALLAGHVALKVLLEYARIPEAEIDELSFTAVDVTSEREVGIYLKAGESRTIESVLEDIGVSSGIVVGTDKMGRFAAFRLELEAAVSFTFTERDIIEIDREPLPYGVPWHSWSLGYARSWTVQSGTELAGNVLEEHRQFAGQEFRTVKATNDYIRSAHWTSRPAPLIESVLTERGQAQFEVGKRIAFYGLSRSMFRVTVKNALFRLEIGKVVTLFLDRFGLEEGQRFVVVAVNEDLGDMTTTFSCFG